MSAANFFCSVNTISQSFPNRKTVIAAAVWILLMPLLCGQEQLTKSNPKDTGATHQAQGSFDVKITPAQIPSAESPLGRMIIDKQYHGELEGSGKGQMLTAGTGAKGSSGAYVALERVTGNLQGRSGSFTLQHRGIMTKGVPQLTIEVVPDSGTDQLAGISGTMKIIIAPDGKHSYEFDYTLAAAP